MSVTIKDIAQAANLSNQAVSAVLNGSSNIRVSAAKREKVLALVKEMNYIPNFSSRHLRNKSTRTVALLLCEKRQKKDDYIKDMIIQLIAGFEEQRYACFLAELTKDAESNVEKVRELAARGVDCFVAVGNPYGAEKIKTLLDSAGKPCFAYGITNITDRYSFSDTAAGVKAIIQFFLWRQRTNFRLLLNEGYKLVPPSEAGARIQGMLAAMPPDASPEELIRRHVVLMPVNNDYDNDALIDIGYQATKDLLQKEKGIQAIVYLTDAYALGGAKYLIERGIHIGKDILLAGFNNIFAVRNFPFPISSAEQDVEKICQTIIRELFMEKKPIAVRIPPILHLRE